MVFTIPTVLVVGLFIFFALKTPYCVYVEKEGVAVKQLWTLLGITDIKSLKPIDKKI